MAANPTSTPASGEGSLPWASVVFTGPASVTLRLAGDIDTLGTPVLEMGLDGVWAHEPSRVIVDLTGVTFIGLPGLHTLVMARCMADRRRIRLGLKVDSGHMSRLLGLVGLGDITESAAPPVPLAPEMVVRPPGEDRPLHAVGDPDLGPVLRTLRWSATNPAGDLSDALRSVAETAASHLLGVEGAGILLIDAAGDVISYAATDPVVKILDLVQQRSRSGPAWESAWSGDAVLVDDLVHDPRWPDVSAEADGLGVRSLLCLHLGSVGDPLGALTVYSCAPAAFGAPVVRLGHVFASIATIALRAGRFHREDDEDPAIDLPPPTAESAVRPGPTVHTARSLLARPRSARRRSDAGFSEGVAGTGEP